MIYDLLHTIHPPPVQPPPTPKGVARASKHRHNHKALPFILAAVSSWKVLLFTHTGHADDFVLFPVSND